MGDLIQYIESTINWHENLIEDQEGYSLLLRWLSEIQDLERKQIFDKMVRTYQQDGEGYLKQAVLRYFMPERLIQVDMKEPCQDAAHQVEDQEPPGAHDAFNPIACYEKKQHVHA